MIPLSGKAVTKVIAKIRTNPDFKGTYGRPILKVLFTNQNTSRDLQPVICRDVWLTVPVVIHTRRNFFLLQKLSEKIELLKSSGLIEMWRFRTFTQLPTKVDNHPRTLSFQHLAGCFQIWLFGCGVGVAVFVIELAMKLRRQSLV